MNVDTICDQICNLWPDLRILGTVQILSFNYCHALRDMHLCSSAIIQKTSHDCKCHVLHPITPCNSMSLLQQHLLYNTPIFELDCTEHCRNIRFFEVRTFQNAGYGNHHTSTCCSLSSTIRLLPLEKSAYRILDKA